MGKMKWPLVLFAILMALVVIALSTLSFSLPYIGKHILCRYGVLLSVGQADVSLLRGRVALENVLIRNESTTEKEDALNLAHLALDLDVGELLVHRVLRIRALEVKRGAIPVAFDHTDATDESAFRIAGIDLNRFSGTEKEPSEADQTSITVEKITVENINIDYQHNSIPLPAHIEKLQVKNIDQSMPDSEAEFIFMFSGAGVDAALDGAAKPFAQVPSAVFSAAVNQLNIEELLTSVRAVGVELPGLLNTASGRIDIAADIELNAPAGDACNAPVSTAHLPSKLST